jgi:hypothetical protein
VDVILAPDVYVNASLALGSAPDKVVQRVLGEHRGESRTTEWILERVKAMLSSVGSFKRDALEDQLTLIRSLVQVIDDPEAHTADEWEKALVGAARAAKVRRVITDHPDLIEKGSSEEVEFISSEAWLFERTMPPPPPPAKARPQNQK